MPIAYLYKSIHIDGVANEESVEDIITSTIEEPLHIDAIAFIEDTAVENYDAILAMYIGREKIIDVPIMQNQRTHDSEVRLNTDPFYPVGHDLEVGESFKTGHVSGAVASDIWYSVRYHIID